MRAERLADDIVSRGERGVAEGLIALARVRGAKGGRQRLFRVGEFGLRLDERGRNRSVLRERRVPAASWASMGI
jgi:hypothetical protein